MKISKYATFLLTINAAKHAYADDREICTGICEMNRDAKVCSFSMKVNLHDAGELGYYTVEECGDTIKPTLGIEKDVTYIFSQEVSLMILLNYLSRI